MGCRQNAQPTNLTGQFTRKQRRVTCMPTETTNHLLRKHEGGCEMGAVLIMGRSKRYV